MLEIVTDAIVLDKEDLGEYDSRVFLYTKDLGKIAAKATSLRKITSKLAGHIDVFNICKARLVSRGDGFNGNGFHLTDALIIRKMVEKENGLDHFKQLLAVFHLVKMVIPELVPDEEVWNFLYNISTSGNSYTIEDALRFLGFDSSFARCFSCHQANPVYFFPKEHSFVCNHCSFSSPERKTLLIKI